VSAAIWLWGALSVASAGRAVAVLDGELRPGREAVIEISDDAATTLSFSGGAVRGGAEVRPQVLQYTVVPDPDAAMFRVAAGAWSETLQVAQAPRPTLSVPAQVQATTADEIVRVAVSGPNLPDPEALAVALSAGSLVGIERAEDGLIVQVDPGDDPFPRLLAVAVQDRRTEARAAWSVVHIRAAPRLPFQSEPGTQMTVRVGGRRYGPFVADGQGAIVGRIEQRPGELSARAQLVDDLGNTVRTDLPLAGDARPLLALVSTGPIVSDHQPPQVYVLGRTPTGRIPEGAPACRTSTTELPVRALHPGAWVLSLPRGDDVRLVCTLDTAVTTLRVGVASGVADRIGLRVWPEDLHTDFPVAEVRVLLEDLRGERMPVDGISVTAAAGDVQMDEMSGLVGRGEYDGAAVAGQGTDRIEARYDPPRGAGAGREVTLGWAAVPAEGGPVAVHGRVLDGLRRPLADTPFVLRLGEQSISVVSDADGWASATLLAPASPTVLAGAVGGRVSRRVLVPGQLAVGGVGTPQLRATQALRISPGRVTGISVGVSPATLKAGPGAVARVVVHLEDRAGQAVTDEPLVLEVTEGELGEPVVQPDGSYVAEYVPAYREQRRQVEITARTAALSSSARLVVEPQDVRVSVGPWVGIRTNFGRVTAPVIGVDVDARVRGRLFGDALMLRVGAEGSWFRTIAETRGVAGEVELRSWIFPLNAAILFRREQGPWSAWGGGGGILAIHSLSVLQLQTQGQRVLVGPLVLGAVARRALGGEAIITLRGSWLASQPGDVGYSGNLGGLAVGIGYRVVQ